MNYGKLELVDLDVGKAGRRVMRQHFKLTVAPQVSIIVKRMFPRVNQGASKSIEMLATDMTARDIEWLMQRYPLEMVGDAGEVLSTAARRFDGTRELISKMQAPDYIAPSVELVKPARAYQLLPAEMVMTSGGILLGDDIGLGKTIEAIVLAMRPGTLPMLYVTKTELPKQMREKFEEFAPALRGHIIKTGRPYGREARGKKGKPRRWDAPLDLAALIEEQGRAFPDVVFMSYSKLTGWAEWLAPRIRTVVYDEIQELRGGMRTDRGAGAAMISERATYRLGMSATPIHNTGGEIHTIMEYVAPDALGSESEFAREWGSGYKGAVTDPDALGAYMRDRGVFLRRTRAEVGRELPDLSILEHTVEHDEGAIKAIEGRAAELANFILSGGGGHRGDAMAAGGELDWKLRESTGIAKAPYIAAFVRMLVESGEKVLLYAWHHAVYAILAQKLSDLAPGFYNGKISVPQRAEAKRRFVEGETSILIMSLRAGAGLDGLQYVENCRTVVFGELDWSPAVHSQAIGRVHRDGIKDPVTAFFLTCDDGSDPIVSERLGLKAAQLRGIMDANSQGNGLAISTEDRARTLAERFLKMRGLPIPKRVTTLTAPAVAEEPDEYTPPAAAAPQQLVLA